MSGRFHGRVQIRPVIDECGRCGTVLLTAPYLIHLSNIRPPASKGQRRSVETVSRLTGFNKTDSNDQINSTSSLLNLSDVRNRRRAVVLISVLKSSSDFWVGALSHACRPQTSRLRLYFRPGALPSLPYICKNDVGPRATAYADAR